MGSTLLKVGYFCALCLLTSTGFAEERVLQYVTDFLQQAHAADERYSVRDGINIARFATKLKSLAMGRDHERMALETAVLETLGEEALRYARANRSVAP